jgi:hypothetical protein
MLEVAVAGCRATSGGAFLLPVRGLQANALICLLPQFPSERRLM